MGIKYGDLVWRWSERTRRESDGMKRKKLYCMIEVGRQARRERERENMELDKYGVRAGRGEGRDGH